MAARWVASRQPASTRRANDSVRRYRSRAAISTPYLRSGSATTLAVSADCTRWAKPNSIASESIDDSGLIPIRFERSFARCVRTPGRNDAPAPPSLANRHRAPRRVHHLRLLLHVSGPSQSTPTLLTVTIDREALVKWPSRSRMRRRRSLVDRQSRYSPCGMVFSTSTSSCARNRVLLQLT